MHRFSVTLSFAPKRSSDNFLSDEPFGTKLRVTENQCVLFNSLTYVYLALLPQHRALHAKVDSTLYTAYLLTNFIVLGGGGSLVLCSVPFLLPRHIKPH